MTVCPFLRDYASDLLTNATRNSSCSLSHLLTYPRLCIKPKSEFSVSHNDEIIAHPFDQGDWKLTGLIGFQV